MKMLSLTAAVAVAVTLAGCGKPPESKPAAKAEKSSFPFPLDKLEEIWHPPGMPLESSKWESPESIKSVDKLFAQNCQACHGRGANVAGSIALDNPMYLAVISEQQLQDIISNGVPHTGMPAFSEEKGGLITHEQIEILAKGIKSWAKTPAPAGPLPPYSAPLGNAQAGKVAFGVSCASCHGADGTGEKGKAGSVVNAAYLGLASDQYLRTITISGRNDLGCPDFQHRVAGRAMTDAEISDVVAWLASQRVNEFGKTTSQP